MEFMKLRIRGCRYLNDLGTVVGDLIGLRDGRLRGGDPATEKSTATARPKR
jgi:hypothetical protein